MLKFFCHFQILAVTIGSTWLAFIKPSINAFFLMTLGIPSIVVLGYNLKREDDRRVINLGWRSILFWVASVTCWINDRIYCNFWSRYYVHHFFKTRNSDSTIQSMMNGVRTGLGPAMRMGSR